jgi:hypothetical protein
LLYSLLLQGDGSAAKWNCFWLKNIIRPPLYLILEDTPYKNMAAFCAVEFIIDTIGAFG